ncbi:type II secretion system ATPase GspE [bacterium]|nr:type II secretion system ATPase GspE [bacterium]
MRKKIGEILIDNGWITEKELEEALLTQSEKKQTVRIGEILITSKKISEKKLYEGLSEQSNLPLAENIAVSEAIYPFLQNLPISYLKNNAALPYEIRKNSVLVAVSEVDYSTALDNLSVIFKMLCIPVLVPAKNLLEAINQSYDHLSTIGGANKLEEINKEDDESDELEALEKDLLEASDDEAPVIRFVNRLLHRAVKERASDIHIEPYEKDVAIRFRIDGVLSEVMKQAKNVHASISSRIKIMGGLNIAEKRLPQDGRIKIKLAGRDIDIRLSTLPTWFGERIVMRLLDQKQVNLSLEKNGFTKENLDAIRNLIHQPHGIVLVTGPTGSGKSTTLYSALSEINSSEKNIITVEDPVEYQIKGISQVQVNSKIDMTFAAGLRSILRQDPDIVMIGEIRDKETAEIAMQASMTGHLVLSTLHTNDTASSPTRLVDMGVEPYLVASTVLGILAQRLVRVLCPKCKIEYTPRAIDLDKIGISESDARKHKFYKANGCSDCLGTGYAGRSGIFELMLMNDELITMIAKNRDASEIKKVARKYGMKTLREDGAIKVLKGITSIDEVLRVTQDEI